MARASILWLLGEYCERVPKVAPDVLRKMAKSFGSEVNTSTTLTSTNLLIPTTACCSVQKVRST